MKCSGSCLRASHNASVPPLGGGIEGGSPAVGLPPQGTPSSSPPARGRVPWVALKPAALAVVLLGLAQTGARAQAPPAAPRDDELRIHLQTLQRRVDDPTLDISVRERVALEMAATLDRAAQAAPTAEARRLRWTEAVAGLDRFRAAHPGAPMARASEVQAAVYLWARARSWVDPGRAALSDAAARDHAVDDLNASLDRLKPAVTAAGFGNDVYAQNA